MSSSMTYGVPSATDDFRAKYEAFQIAVGAKPDPEILRTAAENADRERAR